VSGPRRLRPAAPRTPPTRLTRAQRSPERTGGTPLAEWHQLTPRERAARWAELVEWVAWLHDRYELSVAERLPHCWMHHPPLIEELAILKAWREQIYNAREPSPRDARAWHEHLHEVVAKAGGFYARGCRATHHEPPLTTETEQGMYEDWLTGDPLKGVPQATLRKGSAMRDSLNHTTTDTMRAALDTGEAVPLVPGRESAVRYRSAWWLPQDDGYAHVADPVHAAALTQAAINRSKSEQAKTRFHNAVSVLTATRDILDHADPGTAK
jgi:hypothetical protein